jgi:cob(I)alamin adenosyltransferase
VESAGLVHVYTGPSKGKTTASVGLAARAIGAGWKVVYCSFYKPDGSSEHESLKRLGVDFRRFAWRGNFFKRYEPAEMAEQRRAFRSFLDELEGVWSSVGLVVMDEVVYAVTSNVISLEDFLAFLARKPAHVELVLTGRDFPPAILDRADYVTEMKQVKHPFDKGVLPRRGIEF